MESKKSDNRYWLFFCLYLVSFCMPAVKFNLLGTNIGFGFEAAYSGIIFYGLALPAHISAIGGLIHRLSMKHPDNPNYAWTKVSIVLAVIGTIFWPLIISSFKGRMLIGYYTWMVATCGMAISYYSFREEKSNETRKEEAVQ